MQSVSATLAAAFTAFVRRPFATVVMTLGSAYDTLTPVIESVTVDRSLTTDLPEAAQQVQGFSVAQATITLAGDFADGQGVAQVFSPYRSALGGASPIQAPLTVSIGAVGDTGPESVPVFTGRIRDVSSSSDGKIQLSGLDASEMLRTKVSLAPALKSDPGASNYGPGVTPAWCADQALRQNGYVWRVPPDRASAVLAATMEGSAQPHVGYIAYGNTFGRRAAGPTASGPVVLAPVDSGAWTGLDRNDAVSPGTYAYWNLAAPQAVNSGDLFVEWYKVQVARPSSGSYYLFSLFSSTPGTDGVDIRISSAGVLVADYTRGSTVVTSASLGTLPTSTAYLALHFAFSAAGVTINCRINATTTNAVVANAVAPTDTIRMLATEAVGTTTSTRAYMGALCVTTEAFSSTMWRNSTLYTLTSTAALDSFLGEITACPPVDQEPAWPLLNEIAEAEQGAMLFMEDATVRFYNRTRLQDTTGTAVATFADTRALKALALSQAVDPVRNTVKVGATQYQAPAVSSPVWTLGEVVSLVAGETRTFPVQLPGPMIGAYPGLADTGGGPGYEAHPNPDGTGASATLTGSWMPTGPARGFISMTNPNGFTVWLVDTGGAAALSMIARCIIPSESTFLATASDPGSAATYGDQVLDVSENRFRQTGPAAQGLADLLLSVLKDPHPQVTGVEIVGDPRLQLADRITLLDADGTGLARDFMTVGVRTDQSTGGLTQSLTLRERGPATTGMTGTFTWDVSLWDSLDGWA